MDDVESLLGVQSWRYFPKNITLLHKAKANAGCRAYRIPAPNIEFSRANPEANTISLVSGGPGRGQIDYHRKSRLHLRSGRYSTLIVDR